MTDTQNPTGTPPTPLHVEALSGVALTPALPELARLRIEVFRDFPYLYDGTIEYEQAYLTKFAAAYGAVCVIASDNGRIIGASTGGPLLSIDPSFAAAFEANGYDPKSLFYCSESVLQKGYRGRGLGHAFFDLREAHARKLGGFTHATFASVVRPTDHPLRPADYQPLDAFWTKRGYKRADGITGTYAWTDIDQTAETEKTMQFWIKEL